MRKPVAAAHDATFAPVFPDSDWEELFPLVCDHLSDATYEDGSRRDVSTLSLRCQDGLVLAALNDVDLGRGLYRTGTSVLNAVEALEKALGGATADWRAWNRGKGGARK